MNWTSAFDRKFQAHLTNYSRVSILQAEKQASGDSFVSNSLAERDYVCLNSLVNSAQSLSNLNTSRIGAFSDGVFAIVITLLVLELRVPVLPEHADQYDLAKALLHLWPKFLSYLVSFVVVGVYWVAHHNMFHFIERADRRLLWINNFFLLAVGFIPFPAALIGEYTQFQIAAVIYGLALIFVGVMLTALWRYATKNKRLCVADLDPAFARFVAYKTALAVVLYTFGIVISFFYLNACLIVYLIVPLIYIIPSRLDNWLAARLRFGPKQKVASEGEYQND